MISFFNLLLRFDGEVETVTSFSLYFMNNFNIKEGNYNVVRLLKIVYI